MASDLYTKINAKKVEKIIKKLKSNISIINLALFNWFENLASKLKTGYEFVV